MVPNFDKTMEIVKLGMYMPKNSGLVITIIYGSFSEKYYTPML